MKEAGNRTETRTRGDADWFGELPDGWDVVRIKHLATDPGSLFMDGDWINSDIITEEGVRYLTSGNVGQGRFKEQGSGFISEDTFREMDCLKALPGDLMIARLNEPVGRACIIPEIAPYFVVAVDNVILRPNAGVDRRFLMYAMSSGPFAEEALLAAAGTTMKRISRTNLGNLKLPLPPLPEQQRIVARLDALCAEVDSQAAVVREEIAKLEEWRRSVIADAVTGGATNRADGRAENRKRGAIDWLGELPEGWRVGRVGQYYEVTLGKMLQSLPQTESDTLESYYCAANVHFDGVSNEGLKQMWFSPAEKEETEVQTGDILVVEGGAGAGNTALVKEVPGPTFMQNSVLRIRPSRDSVCNEYLCYHLQWLLRSGYIPYICNKATIPHFTKEKLAKAPLPIPPLPEQQRIVARLDALCAEADGILAARREQLERLDEWRRATIYEYTTGKKRA